MSPLELDVPGLRLLFAQGGFAILSRSRFSTMTHEVRDARRQKAVIGGSVQAEHTVLGGHAALGHLAEAYGLLDLHAEPSLDSLHADRLVPPPIRAGDGVSGRAREEPEEHRALCTLRWPRGYFGCARREASPGPSSSFGFVTVHALVPAPDSSRLALGTHSFGSDFWLLDQ